MGADPSYKLLNDTARIDDIGQALETVSLEAANASRTACFFADPMLISILIFRTQWTRRNWKLCKLASRSSRMAASLALLLSIPVHGQGSSQAYSRLSTTPKQTSFEFVEQPGPYPVGFRVVDQFDYSRSYRHEIDELGKPFSGERARPIQTLIWYPAKRAAVKPMLFSEYVKLSETETSFADPAQDPNLSEWRSNMASTLNTVMWAVRDASPASGTYPIAIYAPGASSVGWENADLCEYLASHGYVVISSASIGPDTRIMSYDLAGIEAQARDITFLISFARTLKYADTSLLALVGHSWGGLSNLLVAARDNRVRAMVSLDGSMRYLPSLVGQAGDVHPERMSTPLLAFIQRNFSLEMQDKLSPEDRTAPNILNMWDHGDLVMIHMLSLSHVEFSSRFQRNDRYWSDVLESPSMLQGDYGPREAAEGYGWMARYTLNFLDFYLKRKPTAATFLHNIPAQNGVAPHMLTIQLHAARNPPPSLDQFRLQLGQLGFDHAAELYSSFSRAHPDFRLDEITVRSWANELMRTRHLREASHLLLLNVQNHPNSPDAYIALGDVYGILGEIALARQAYEKSIPLSPEGASSSIRRKLHDLGN
jgi:pimeloyl-ACP methyl ester carboxylesterase